MDLPIISKETIRARGRAAYAAGRGRDDHRMNPGAAAIAEWQAGWDEAGCTLTAVVCKRLREANLKEHATCS